VDQEVPVFLYVDRDTIVLLGSVVFQLADSFIGKDSLVFRNELCDLFRNYQGHTRDAHPY
jgi:hypothetical protein